MIVVGLSGHKGSGKDTVADILVRDYGFTKMAFAEPLKRMLKALDPMVGVDQASYYCSCEDCGQEVYPVTLGVMYDEWGLTDEEIKRSVYGEEVRRLWERFGTEVFREEDEDYWVAKSELALEESTAERVVFTDVRFENEAEMIYAQRSENIHSSVWQIARPGFHGGEHPAEQGAGLLGEEVTILNAGTIHELEEPVAIAMDMLLNNELPGQMVLDLEGL